jgi:hypothetical protein
MPRGTSTNDLKRRSANHKSRNYLLIVVEGEETEYNYFDSLKRELKLPLTTTIKIAPSAGGDPLMVVNEAYKLYQENQEKSKTGNTIKFDQVFCVFDDDNKPEKYKKALTTAKKYNFTAITSIPCFEFWFLLHYCYTTSPFSSYKELCPKLEAEMRKAGILKQGKNYDKSDKSLYEKLRRNQETAINNAIKLENKHPNEDGCTNPSTKVHILVQKLQDQKEFK